MTPARKAVTLAFALTLALPGCKREKTIDPRTHGPLAEASTPSPEKRADAPRVSSPEVPPAYADPPRVRLGSADEAHVLRPHAEVVRAHFGAVVPLELQMVALPSDRRALLVSAAEGDARPILLVIDGRKSLLWSRERPLAGLRPGVRHVALASGPDGEVLAAWHDTEAKVVAARRWTADGGLLADFQVMDADGCDAFAALYWPTRGWVIVTSQQGSARAQLLGERGNRAWGNAGRDVAPGFRGPAPLGLALDGEDGVVIVYPGYAANGLTRDVRDRFFALRLDEGGHPTWPAPIDLGEAPLLGKRPLPKPALAQVERGVVRVSLAKGSTDALEPYDLELTTAGKVLVR